MAKRLSITRWACAWLAVCAAVPVWAQEAVPFRTRNLSPPATIFGLPSWGLVPDDKVFAVTTELANHYRLSRRGNDTLILDGETLRMTFFYERPLGERWSFGAELPILQQSGGVLDNLIDGWHSAFNLPDGGRNNRPDNDLLFQIAQGAQPFFNLTGSEQGIGDLQLSLARRIGLEGDAVLRATVKLATGKESILAGSGATDWLMTYLRPRQGTLGRRPAGYYWGVGAMALGRPKQIAFKTEDAAVVGLLGGGLQLTPRLGVKAQVEVHSALYDTPLEELGQPAVQLTLGGWWQLSEIGRLDFAVVEDLHVSTAPDVVIYVGLRWDR